MWLERPDTDEYIKLLDTAVTYRYEADKLENELNILVANCIKKAIDNKVKSREIDAIKIIGDTENNEHVLELRKTIIEEKHKADLAWNRVKQWIEYADLYKKDYYAQQRSLGFGNLVKSEDK